MTQAQSREDIQKAVNNLQVNTRNLVMKLHFLVAGLKAGAIKRAELAEELSKDGHDAAYAEAISSEAHALLQELKVTLNQLVAVI